MNTADLRREYHRATLTETDVDASPVTQFERWLGEAVKAELAEPTAMTLATVGEDRRPAARIVLLKGVDAEGFLFFTNYDSRKGRELSVQPFAALLFHWVELERQVRVEGEVSRASAAESDAYFASRPRLSRIGAWASPQSDPIPDRGWLEREFSAAQERFAANHDSIPRPPHFQPRRRPTGTVSDASCLNGDGSGLPGRPTRGRMTLKSTTIGGMSA